MLVCQLQGLWPVKLEMADMHDFSHLSPGGNTGTIRSSARPYTSQYAAIAAVCSAIADDGSKGEEHHSDAHWIAVSREAKNNPVLALKLIKQGKPQKKAISILAASPRHLSEFTKRKMVKVCPGWECLDTEDRNMAAFIYSTTYDDGNGYLSGFRAAQNKIEKYIEPWNEEDIRSVKIN